MSDKPDLHKAQGGPHEGPIRTPKQLMLAVIFAFLIPIVGIFLLVTFVSSDERTGAGSEAMSEQAVALRIQPVGTVALDMSSASGPAVLRTGEEVFTAQCAACHGTGAMGAPKFGDAAAWGPRIGQGYDALLNSALKGKNAMTPQGGGQFSDYEIGRAVVYMVNNAGGKLPEPPAPAGAPADAAAADAAPADAAAAQPAAPAQAAAPAQPATPTPVAAPAKPAAPAAAPAPAAAKVDANAGEALYKQSCAACHATGVAGAPKFGDKAAWAPRLALGVDGLTASAIKGKNAMPPRGASSASDAELRAAVAYMVNAAK